MLVSRYQKWAVRISILLGLTVVAAGIVIGQGNPLPPLVSLPSEPLYMNGAKTKGNLTLALSVEFPTVGQTYRDVLFDKTKEYVGYFDPKACYRHVPGQNFFDWNGALTDAGECSGGGGAFSGNFMNWATSSAIDILRYGLTGGNRIVDESSGNAKTVLQRAWLPDNFYNNGTYFTAKSITKAQAASLVETSLYNKIDDGGKLWIYNCKNRVYFAKSEDTNASSTCDKPFNVANLGSNQLIGSTNNQTHYDVNMLVCDPNSATNRLMTYNPETKQWKGLCFRYPSGNYKPVGQFQVNAENLRVAVLSYLQDDSRSRYGGVLRAPLKYLGPKTYDNNFNLEVAANARAEWNTTNGVFTENPQSGDANYGSQGFTQSGAINYINRFGTLDPDNVGKYKNLDPLSELYYEAVRYLQGKQPTPEAITSVSGSIASKTRQENFPAYTSWTDPFAGFQDASTTTGKGCMRNSILTIADKNTHSDRSLPGNSIITNEDFLRSVESNPALDVPFWTSVVGSFESKSPANVSLSYTDSQGTSRLAGNLSANTLYPLLANAATMQAGADGGSHYMAGLAYWANTQSFRTDVPKARITTYTIDVNEGRASDDISTRRQTQLYLSAKYGGFDDSATGNTGNPYSGGTNALWQATDGDAKNYFLVSDAGKFLDSLAEVFARVVEETGSIAGGAISTQRLTVGQSASVFQARFNPVANYWSGRLLKYPLSLNGAGTSLVIGSTPTWEAGQIMTQRAVIDNGDNRKIFIGAPIGEQATVAPTRFLWADLAQTHKNQLNVMPYTSPSVTDTLGLDRLSYLRGDRRKEIRPGAPTEPFRARDIVLGDIVNSGLVYMGPPSQVINDSGYAAFFSTNKTRRPVIFANANDGMLHAINDDDGTEAFAYIPGFVAGKLNQLTSQDYEHFTINDSTPAVGEAYVGSTWKSVLVSGVGAGGQGVFALDVTNPASFDQDKVMWEFTHRDHPAMGNVIGTPQIVKMRTSNKGTSPATFKWYALVASGVNNYAADGYAHSNANPSLFIIDLSRKPSAFPAEAPWTEGTNFWRVELPQTSTAIASGLAGFTTVKNPNTGAVDFVFAGDLQGNVWKLDFSTELKTANGIASLTASASGNLTKVNAIASTTTPTFFVAKDSSGGLQPITGEPAINNGLFNSRLISFGTGKYLETGDTSVPSTGTSTFYTLMDNSNIISGRSVLQPGSTSNGGTVTVPSFIYGLPTNSKPDLKMGWYLDLDRTLGERQISDITTAFGQLFFGTLYPTKGACGEGGGRFYALNALTGSGVSEESKVGILAAPLVLEIGSLNLTRSDTTGQRTATRKLAVITQGSKGLGVVDSVTDSLSYKEQVGRLSWRQLNNYQENKN